MSLTATLTVTATLDVPGLGEKTLTLTLKGSDAIERYQQLAPVLNPESADLFKRKRKAEPDEPKPDEKKPEAKPPLVPVAPSARSTVTTAINDTKMEGRS